MGLHPHPPLSFLGTTTRAGPAPAQWALQWGRGAAHHSRAPLGLKCLYQRKLRKPDSGDRPVPLRPRVCYLGNGGREAPNPSLPFRPPRGSPCTKAPSPLPWPQKGGRWERRALGMSASNRAETGQTRTGGQAGRQTDREPQPYHLLLFEGLHAESAIGVLEGDGQ